VKEQSVAQRSQLTSDYQSLTSDLNSTVEGLRRRVADLDTQLMDARAAIPGSPVKRQRQQALTDATSRADEAECRVALVVGEMSDMQTQLEETRRVASDAAAAALAKLHTLEDNHKRVEAQLREELSKTTAEVTMCVCVCVCVYVSWAEHCVCVCSVQRNADKQRYEAELPELEKALAVCESSQRESEALVVRLQL
jgi:hypothetical protein